MRRVLEVMPTSPLSTWSTEKMQRKEVIREGVDVWLEWRHSAVDIMDLYDGCKDTPRLLLIFDTWF